MRALSITLPQECPNWKRRAALMAIGLVGSLALCAFRWAEYVAYLEGAARV